MNKGNMVQLKPDISIIVPIYNSEDTIEICLNSLLAQTHKDIEILCIDDGSSDSTPQILERFAAEHANIRVFPQKESGVSAARNVGLAHASAEYIGFLDSDDWADANMFERMLSAARASDADVVACNYWRHDPGDASPIKTTHRMDVPYLRAFSSDYKLFGTRSYVWDKLYARKAIEKSGALFLEDERTFEEFAVAYRWLDAANKVLLLDDALMHHNNDNSSSLMSGGFLLGLDMLRSLERSSQWFLDQGLPQEGIDQLCAMNIRHIIYRLAEFRRSKNKEAKLEFVDAAFEHLDRLFPGWKKNPYYAEDRGLAGKMAMKLALLSPGAWHVLIKLGIV